MLHTSLVIHVLIPVKRLFIPDSNTVLIPAFVEYSILLINYWFFLTVIILHWRSSFTTPLRYQTFHLVMQVQLLHKTLLRHLNSRGQHFGFFLLPAEFLEKLCPIFGGFFCHEVFVFCVEIGREWLLFVNSALELGWLLGDLVEGEPVLLLFIFLCYNCVAGRVWHIFYGYYGEVYRGGLLFWWLE